MTMVKTDNFLINMKFCVGLIPQSRSSTNCLWIEKAKVRK